MTLSHRLELLLGLSLLLSFFGWGRKVMFPFQLFTTWVHECWHAMAALLLGGHSVKITISTDGSGLTEYRLPSGRLRQALVASAGYLGSSLTGCLILFLAISTEHSSHFWNLRSMTFTLSILIGLTLVFWIRNAFGWFSTLTLGLAVFALNYPPLNRYAEEVFLFLSIQTALNALFDIRTLFRLGSGKSITSDAHTMQKLFYLPYWCWAISWLALSAFFMFWTVRYEHLI